MTIPKRELGKSGVMVTELGFGGAPVGALGPKIEESVADDMIDAAYQGGVRYFDTAPLYGHGESERRVGRGVRRYDRDSFALSTKAGRLLVPMDECKRFEGMLDTNPVSIQYDYTYDGARRSFEESLERLGIDRVDVLLCHDIDKWTHGDTDQPQIFKTAMDGILRALAEYREQGLIRAFGLGVNEWQVCADVLDHYPADCFLLAGRFTLLEQDPLDVFLPKCLEHNASIIIGGPYNSGLLAVTERRFATYDYKPASDDLWEKAQAIRKICESHDVDIRAAALKYPLRHPAVASVIPGPRKLSEVHENLELIATDIPDQLWTDLADAGLSRSVS